MRSILISAAILFAGFGLLIYTWWPIAKWQLVIKPKFVKSANFLSPLAELPLNQAPQQLLPATISFENQIGRQNEAFFLTIEKFGIRKAKVKTGDNFKTQLAHLPGTALPGEAGNVFISGHSVLPQFFAPDSYLSIFSKLYLLEVGDKIILESQDKSFVYRVSETLVVEPDDSWVISPPAAYGSYLTLLTCGVGGFSLERIIIRGTLQNSQKLI